MLNTLFYFKSNT